jgi:hypothetical protein
MRLQSIERGKIYEKEDFAYIDGIDAGDLSFE